MTFAPFAGTPSATAFECTGFATNPLCCYSEAVVGTTVTDCESDNFTASLKFGANDTLGAKAPVITVYVPQKTEGLLTTTLCVISEGLPTQPACCEKMWASDGLFVSSSMTKLG